MIIVVAVLGFFGYQYAVHGDINMDRVFEPIVCPNGYGMGDVVEHVTGNFKGLIESCNTYTVLVELGNGQHHWPFDEVVEFKENGR